MKLKWHKKTEAIQAKRRQIKAEIKQATAGIMQRHKTERFGETIETPATALSDKDEVGKYGSKIGERICGVPSDRRKKSDWRRLPVKEQYKWENSIRDKKNMKNYG